MLSEFPMAAVQREYLVLYEYLSRTVLVLSLIFDSR